MRILLLGANGFIGARVLGRLLADGHRVRAAVRDPARLCLRFSRIDAVRADLNRFLARRTGVRSCTTFMRS